MRDTWVVPADLPVLAGHFPGRPIVPGVVLLDRVLRLAARSTGRESGWRVDNAKFFQPVGPGAELVFEITLRPSGALAFTVRCQGRDVAAGTLHG
ncbi:MAG: hypothetical protein R3E94_07945 [Burkholderiaceae bacterium]